MSKRGTRSAKIGEDVVEKIRTLYESGSTLTEIGDEVVLSEVQITKIIKDNEFLRKPAPKTKLVIAPTEDQETFLVHFLHYLKPVCWNWKLRTFKHFLQRFAHDCGIKFNFSHSWRCEFVERHETELPPRTKELFRSTKNTKTSGEPVSVGDFFALVSDLYKELDITEKPQCIWNFSSTDVEVAEPQKKIHRKNGPKEPELKQELISVLCAVSAEGAYAPASLLFRGVRVANEWKSLLNEEDKDKIQLYVNSTGSPDHTIAIKWMKNVFARNSEPRPLVLIVDNYFSHTDNYEFFKSAFDNQIHIVSIPKKLSNKVTTPLALTVLKTLKDKWYEGLDEIQMAISLSVPLSRPQITQALLPAYAEALESSSVKGSFEKCGFYPLNPNANPKEALVQVAPQEDMAAVPEVAPLSPETQQAVDEALEVYARAGIPENKARRLLHNMNVPGF